jgi:hypothetical protein
LGIPRGLALREQSLSLHSFSHMSDTAQIMGRREKNSEVTLVSLNLVWSPACVCGQNYKHGVSSHP